MTYVKEQVGDSSTNVTVDTAIWFQGGKRQALDKLDDAPVIGENSKTKSRNNWKEDQI